MKIIVAMMAIVLAVSSSAASAEEGGCLKYGAVGGAAGHFVGSGHAVAGAATGCALGMWKRHKARQEEKAQEERAATEELNRTSHEGGVNGLRQYSRQNGYATDGYDQRFKTE